MNTTELAVVAGGLAAIVAVNWWFFFADRAGAAAATDSAGVQEVKIRVAGGYSPATVRVRAGQPVRLLFDRQETDSCSEEIVFPDFGIRRFLPAHQETAIEVRPEKPGTYEFMCGMSMLHGRMIAE